MTDSVLTKEAKLQVIQHVPRFEIPAYKCKLTRDLAISYCGFSSYTQHLPFGYYGQSYALTREECRMAVQEKRFKTVLGVYKELKVPGLTAFQEIIAGEERFEAGVVTCVGEHAHLQGRFLKGVVAEQSYKLVVEEETIISHRGRLTAESDNAEVACSLASQGCQGAESTYWWGTSTEPCMYKHVTHAVGDWDAAGRLFVGKQPAVTFNISGAPQVHVPSECKGSGEALQGTQYHDLFIH